MLKIRSQRWPRLTMAGVTLLLTLACGLIESEARPARQRVVLHRLPTLTPTIVATAAQVIEPVQAIPVSTPLPLPPATSTRSEIAPVSPAAANSQAILTPVVVLNVRSGPGLDYPVLGKLTPGQAYQVAGKNPEGSWWQIIYPPGSGSLAWVSAEAQYATVSGGEAVPIAQLPPPPAATPIPAAAAPTVPASSDPPGAPPPAPTATTNTASPDWAFAGVRVYSDHIQGGLLLHGKALNHTGAAQELVAINGTFYDGQGQVIADQDDSYAYWPGYVVPPGGSVPFELLVDGIGEAARFDLNVEAKPSDNPPRQDFNVSNVNQQTEGGDYCLAGELRNPGRELEDYLIVAAVLYDSQDNVLNFGDYEEFGQLQGNASNFEICIDRPSQDIARYEVVAWGR